MPAETPKPAAAPKPPAAPPEKQLSAKFSGQDLMLFFYRTGNGKVNYYVAAESREAAQQIADIAAAPLKATFLAGCAKKLCPRQGDQIAVQTPCTAVDAKANRKDKARAEVRSKVNFEIRTFSL